MTDQKSLKRRVRERMSKTGERYTAARHQLLKPADSAPATVYRAEWGSADETMRARTGRNWQEWFDLLDAWGGRDRSHPEIARWLVDEHGVDGWWAQEVTVGYEVASGRRKPGQRPDGFSVSASKTVGVPIERLFEAFLDEGLRARWLPDHALVVRTATAPRTARFDFNGGPTRLALNFTAKGSDRSNVAIAHERLPDADAAAEMKAFWRDRMAALRTLLEG